jgi:hypothetical protein
MRLKRLAILVTICGILVWGCQTTAHDGRGGLTLEPRMSTGALALGETGLTEIGHVTGFGVNPACLPLAGSFQVGAYYGDLIEGVPANTASVALAIPFGSPVDYDEKGPIVRRFGIGISVDHQGFELARGSSWSTETVSLGFGYGFTPYASAGILTKVLISSSDIDSAGATGYGFDIGGRLAVHPRLDFALVLRNIAASARWDEGENETPPLIVSIGGSYEIVFGASAAFALSLVDDQSKYGLGLDIPLVSDFHVRFGYLHHPGDHERDILTGGFSYDGRRLRLGYAVRNDEEDVFGLTHHFSIGGSLR